MIYLTLLLRGLVTDLLINLFALLPWLGGCGTLLHLFHLAVPLSDSSAL